MDMLNSLEQLAHSGMRISLALGIFDGVHLGHQEIFHTLVRVAKETSSVPVAMFFSPHPRHVLFPPGPKYLTKSLYKCQLLSKLGVQYTVEQQFTRELANLSAEEFLDKYCNLPGLEVVRFCVGENWRFGKGNSAGTQELSAWAIAHGSEACIVPCVKVGGSNISSTRIRNLIENGNLNEAATLLGRPFDVSGTICHGNAIGRKINCATANIVDSEHLLPPDGVYAGYATLPDSSKHPAIVYVGKAPTIRDDAPESWVELHLLDCNADLYDKDVVISFSKFIRKDQKFASQEELAAQIQRDIKVARS